MSEDNEKGTIEENYIPSMSLTAAGLRDHWLKNFSQNGRIGKTYGAEGAVLFEGKTAIEWLFEFKIIDIKNKNYDLTPAEVQSLWIKLAHKYNTAASFHANFLVAAKALESELVDAESKFIKEEVAKYAPGGVYWSDEAKKPIQKRPAAGTLAEIAKSKAADARKALRSLEREAEFFHHCMMNLETQRRCLKDYSEMLSLDPTRRGLS